jgi:hypothetical protein
MSTIDEEMVVAHFIVSDDVERSRRFYTEVLGGKTVISSEAGDEVTSSRWVKRRWPEVGVHRLDHPCRRAGLAVKRLRRAPTTRTATRSSGQVCERHTAPRQAASSQNDRSGTMRAAPT